MTALAQNIATLSLDEIDLIDGGRLSADQVGSWGNAAASAGAVAMLVGAEPVGLFLIGFGIGCHLVAAM